MPLIKPNKSKSNKPKSASKQNIEEMSSVITTCWRHDNSKLYCAALAVILALLIGGGVFSLLEKPGEIIRMGHKTADHKLILDALGGNQTLFDYIANHSRGLKNATAIRTTHWDWDDGIFFSLMIITTLGISEEFPKSPQGQIFCGVYALFCIPLMGLFLMLLGRRLVTMISYVVQMCCMRQEARDQMTQETFDTFDNDKNGYLDEYEFRNALTTMGVDDIDDDKLFQRILLAVDVDGDEMINFDEFKLAVTMLDCELSGPTMKHFRLRVVVVLAFTWLVIGSMVFAYSEGWHIHESFYFTVTILTAIGTGDFVPNTNRGYILFASFVICGLGIFSTILTILASHYKNVENVMFNKELQNRERLIIKKRKSMGY